MPSPFIWLHAFLNDENSHAKELFHDALRIASFLRALVNRFWSTWRLFWAVLLLTFNLCEYLRVASRPCLIFEKSPILTCSLGLDWQRSFFSSTLSLPFPVPLDDKILGTSLSLNFQYGIVLTDSLLRWWVTSLAHPQHAEVLNQMLTFVSRFRGVTRWEVNVVILKMHER